MSGRGQRRRDDRDEQFRESIRVLTSYRPAAENADQADRYERLSVTYGEIAESYEAISASQVARGAGRGEKWSTTYQARKARRYEKLYAELAAIAREGATK